MKVPDDLTDRMRAAAADIPPQVWGALLGKMLPKVPISKRAPEPSQGLRLAPEAKQPAGFAAVGKAKRLPKRTVMACTIQVTGKGRRKCKLSQLDDQIHEICNEGERVSAVVGRRGVQYGDVTYAWRTGYIQLVRIDGEVLRYDG